jgi:hypothetical protein
MTATQNNFLGPAALIFSCCFPAEDGWDTETCGTSAAHEISNARNLHQNDCEMSPRSFLNRIRRQAVVCGGGSRLGRPMLQVF